MAVLDPLKLTITNWPAGQVELVDVTLQNNPEDPTTAPEVPFTGELWIEQDDFMIDARPSTSGSPRAARCACAAPTS
jgi:glutaminyl-tRNA synthetase